MDEPPSEERIRLDIDYAHSPTALGVMMDDPNLPCFLNDKLPEVELRKSGSNHRYGPN